jgi:hypothetical protein
VTRRVSPSVPTGTSAGASVSVRQTLTEAPADDQATVQLSGQEPPGNGPGLVSEKPGRRRARRSRGDSARPTPTQDPLEEWAAAVAAAMPPLPASQVAAVARIAARLDASHSQVPAE